MLSRHHKSRRVASATQTIAFARIRAPRAGASLGVSRFRFVAPAATEIGAAASVAAGPEQKPELQVAVVASLASARRRDGLTCCDVQLDT